MIEQVIEQVKQIPGVVKVEHFYIDTDGMITYVPGIGECRMALVAIYTQEEKPPDLGVSVSDVIGIDDVFCGP